MLMTSSMCLANPSRHQRRMGTDTEPCQAIWLPTGLTSPTQGKILFFFYSLKIISYSTAGYVLQVCLSSLQTTSLILYFNRDPNKGNMKVPVTWPEFTSSGHKFLEINAKMNESSVGQEMRWRFVRLWASVLPSLPLSDVTHAEWCIFVKIYKSNYTYKRSVQKTLKSTWLLSGAFYVV